MIVKHPGAGERGRVSAPSKLNSSKSNSSKSNSSKSNSSKSNSSKLNSSKSNSSKSNSSKTNSGRLRDPARQRSGFTLLEVLLASMIAVLLFGALYVAMQVELQQASVGRDAIERSTLARSIINRLTIDLTPSLTPPRALQSASSSSSSSSSSSGSTSSSSPTSSSSSSSSSDSTTQTATVIPAQAGVIGDTTWVIIFASRTPDPRATPQTEDGQPIDTGPVPSDIRRITYWLGSNGGLCRQEIKWFTSDSYYSSNTVTLEPGKSDDDYVIAKEVNDLSFEYYDINSASGDDSGWQGSWDGSQPGPDGMTPNGPPTAIRVHFSVLLTDPSGNTETKNYTHVIPLLTASGPSADSTAGGTTQAMQ